MKLKNLVVIFVIALLFSNCGTTKSGMPGSYEIPGEGESEDAPSAFSVKTDRVFMDAQKAKVLGDIEEARKLFEQVIRMDPSNYAAKYELSLIYFHANNVQESLKLAKEAAKGEPQNKWYQMLYADLLSATNQNKEAAEVYGLLAKNNPKDVDLYFEWAHMLIQANKIQEAINVYDQLELMIGLEESVIFQKQKLYLRNNDIDAAAKEINKLIDSDPNEPAYYGVLAEMYEANGMNEKALQSYDKLLKVDADNPYALLAIADLNNRMGNKEGYFENIKTAFGDANLDIDTKVRILYPYIEKFDEREENKTEAFELAKILTETHPDEAKAFAIQGDLFNLDNQFENALLSYKKSLNINSDIYTVWQQVLIIQSELKNFTALLEDCKKAIELFPNQPLNYLMKGIANQQLKENSEALKAFDRGQKMSVDNKKLKAQFFSNMGDIFYEIKNNIASDSCYDASLELDPDNPFVLNNYSYYLSLREEKLEQAEKMSKRSNELVPGSSAFQDTYAWILYKLKKYKDAKTWQEKALETDGGKSPVLLEHYGDILYMNGEVAKAVEYWQKALDLGSESTIIGKKIADRKLYED